MPSFLTSDARTVVVVAVGAAGTILERRPDGTWRALASGTRDLLSTIRPCGGLGFCASGPSGVTVT